jgi:two-component system chemotaxis sensor kinase CheA
VSGETTDIDVEALVARIDAETPPPSPEAKPAEPKPARRAEDADPSAAPDSAGEAEKTPAQAEEPPKPAPRKPVKGTPESGEPAAAKEKTSPAAGTGADSTAKLADDSVRVATAKLDSLMAQVGELLAGHIGSEQRLTEVGAISDSLGEWEDAWRKVLLHVRNLKVAFGEGSPGQTGEGVHVAFGATLLRDILTVVPYLEESEIQVQQLRSQVEELRRNLAADARRMGQVTNDLQEAVRRTRMLPVSAVFDTFPRMVRDLAKDLGKKATLELAGGDTEVDRSVLEQIKGPLTHLLRNCLDHGLEKPAERTAVGKAGEGLIKLSAAQRGGRIVIEVEDDGSGIDVERIREVAVEKNLVPTTEAAQALSDREAMRLIFRSRLSTAPIITDVSGRGVGLDVVRANVERLHGVIDVDSKPGEGTRFILSLPLTVATTYCLLVQVVGQTFALPITNVGRIMRVEPHDIDSSNGRAAMRMEGGPVPVARLEDVLGMDDGGDATVVPRQPAVVIESAERRVAFLVSALAGAQEVVIKNLPKPLERVRCTAGATILGTGEVVMILNIGDLVLAAESSGARSVRAPVVDEAAETRTMTVLVVDDSIVTRMLEKSILEAAGYDVAVASDGLEAWNLMQSEEYDLMVSDINMPRLDGFDLTTKVRASDTLKNLPIVLVTSRDSPEDRERGVEAGADAYIVKSAFSQDRLLDTIRRLI